jgi:hypothetical protein
MCVQGMGYNGVPMGNMSNQQLMQMQLHGMDLQRMGAGLPGNRHDCLLAYVCMPQLCERSESSPMNGCEYVPCPAVIVRRV